MSSTQLGPNSGFDTLKNELEKIKDGIVMKEKNMNFGWLRYVALAAGGYALWANRFRIQRFLSAQGISTPLMNGSFGEAIQSGAAKVSGAVEHEVKSFKSPSVN